MTDAIRLTRALLRSRKFRGMLSLGLRRGSLRGSGAELFFEDSFEGVGDFDVGWKFHLCFTLSFFGF